MTELEWNDTVGVYVPKGSGLQSEPSSFPPPHQQAWNLAKSVAAFVTDGCRTVTKEQYQARLETCDTCDYRQDIWCLKCGCCYAIKAEGRVERCLENKWPEVPGKCKANR